MTLTRAGNAACAVRATHAAGERRRRSVHEQREVRPVRKEPGAAVSRTPSPVDVKQPYRFQGSVGRALSGFLGCGILFGVG